MTLLVGPFLASKVSSSIMEAAGEGSNPGNVNEPFIKQPYIVNTSISSSSTVPSVNVSDNSTDYFYDYDSVDYTIPLTELIPVTLVYGVTLILGLVGNLLVIVVVAR